LYLHHHQSGGVAATATFPAISVAIFVPQNVHFGAEDGDPHAARPQQGLQVVFK
jgi:hypothetical protein